MGSHYYLLLGAVGVPALLSVYTKAGIENAHISERRHLHNLDMAQRVYRDFPKVGHYDTWKIYALQKPVEQNTGKLLYPGWTCDVVLQAIMLRHQMAMFALYMRRHLQAPYFPAAMPFPLSVNRKRPADALPIEVAGETIAAMT
ncbi:hypothetical protein IV203_031591 [Nitzschia inconspicua]|uniref:Uncharacterized protein n=1 Tax=Nitzschia inconspicua TaxID=303405 RepID=A0A9K3Q2R8_9STRA|nr:hypothetical protein IV203_031591 [Nitzschia inconspicua]